MGRNGDGKTTVYNLILGNLLKDSGDISIFNQDLKRMKEKIKEIVAFMPENDYFYERWSIKKNLDFIKNFFKN